MQSKQPENQFNLLIAVVLSMAVMLGWQFFFAAPQVRQAKEQIAREKQAETTPTAPGAVATSGAELKSGAAGATTATWAATREEALARSPRLPIETPALKGSIALKGALIDDLVLTNYHETVDKQSPNIVLLSPPEGPGAYFARHGWTSADAQAVKLPGGDTAWTVQSTGPLTPASPAVLVWDNGEGLKFRRKITVDDNYMFSIVDDVENTTRNEIKLGHFGRLFRFGSPKSAAQYIQHEGLLGVPGDAGLQELTFGDALKDGGDKWFDNKTGGWIGVSDKYWATALIPDQKMTYKASLQGEKSPFDPHRDAFLADYEQVAMSVPAGGAATSESRMFAGAKQAQLVAQYERQYEIKKFDLLIDWGWFYFITKPLNSFIHWLYGILGNFGLAILAVTVMVKALFYPLANKSYASMAKMKKLQPKMEELRARFKDDKARQQQELMKLYQTEKINPLAGCLPILVQIPVFFALYKVLFISIDMRHAPFFGWIKDLSAPDPTSLFNLFGLLPFAAPDFLHVGVWPIIMGITMWVQMQLNPPQPDPVQQQVFAWMPLIFTFLLASFPAGLVIYWAWNNLLSIIQQWHISKKVGAEVHLLGNIKRTFAPVIKMFSKADSGPGKSE